MRVDKHVRMRVDKHVRMRVDKHVRMRVDKHVHMRVDKHVRLPNDKHVFATVQMPLYVVHHIQSALNKVKKPLNGSRILLFGVAYKSNIGMFPHMKACGSSCFTKAKHLCLSVCVCVCVCLCVCVCVCDCVCMRDVYCTGRVQIPITDTLFLGTVHKNVNMLIYC